MSKTSHDAETLLADIEEHLPDDHGLDSIIVAQFVELTEFVDELGQFDHDESAADDVARVGFIARETQFPIAAVEFWGTGVGVACANAGGQLEPMEMSQYGPQQGPVQDMERLKADVEKQIKQAIDVWG